MISSFEFVCVFKNAVSTYGILWNSSPSVNGWCETTTSQKVTATIVEKLGRSENPIWRSNG